MNYADTRLARASLRGLIRGGRSMDYADWALRNAIITPFVHARYVRLWAWSTATEHKLTAGVPIARWSARRERIQQAVSRFLDKRA